MSCEELKSLNSVSIATQYDGTFIRILLEILYKNDLNVLSLRSFSGRTTKARMAQLNLANNTESSQTESFKAISPPKKNKIFSQFKERIMKSNVTKQEQLSRLQSTNISRLVAIAIGNIRKAEKKLKHHFNLNKHSAKSQHHFRNIFYN